MEINDPFSNIQRPQSWTRIQKTSCKLIDTLSMKIIPLKNIEYKVKINGGLANVVLKQHYFNEGSKTLDISYLFPILEGYVFSSLEIEMGNMLIKGIIKEKTAAKAEFEHHKAQGNTVAYAEQYTSSQDMMMLKIGNLKPQTKVVVCLGYLVRLDVLDCMYWGFRIPATLTPRYKPDNFIPNSENTPMLLSGRCYPWSIDVKIYWPGGAKNIYSLTHQNQIQTTQEPGMIHVKFDPSLTIYPDKDFELLIEDKALFSNHCSVSVLDPSENEYLNVETSPKYAAMLQFVPSMYQWYAEKKPSNILEKPRKVSIYQDEETNFLLESTKAEFIFIIDRSGSMAGDRIEMAKQSLILCLKSLPFSSRFNIISFGSSCKFMSSICSMEVDPNNIDFAIKKIRKFKADMGGTEILTSIRLVNQQPGFDGYQKNIFLLTDGDVMNINEVVKEIETACYFNQARVFTIGIGNGCSDHLIKQAALKGNGKSVFIKNNNGLQAKTIALLNDSLSPSLTDFEVEFDQNLICALSPLPNKKSHILRNEPFVLYALLNNEIEQAENMSTEITVNFLDSVTGKKESRKFILKLEGAICDSSFHKMCISSLIKNAGTFKKNFFLNKKLSSTAELWTRFSVGYQVLSSELTAFVCLVKYNEEGKDGDTENVLVPNHHSVDYDKLNNGRVPSWGRSIVHSGGVSLQRPVRRSKGGGSCCGGGGGGSYSSYDPTPASSYQDKMNNESANDSTTTGDTVLNSNFMKIAELQESDGSWKCSKDLKKMIGFEGDFKKKMSEIEGMEKDLQLMTLLVIVWLIQNAGSEFSLIIGKGKYYLKKSGLSFDEKYYVDFDKSEGKGV